MPITFFVLCIKKCEELASAVAEAFHRLLADLSLDKVLIPVKPPVPEDKQDPVLPSSVDDLPETCSESSLQRTSLKEEDRDVGDGEDCGIVTVVKEAVQKCEEDLPEIEVRDMPEIEVRDMPKNEVRDMPEVEVKDTPEIQVRDAALLAFFSFTLFTSFSLLLLLSSHSIFLSLCCRWKSHHLLMTNLQLSQKKMHLQMNHL